ncbi:Anti-sigma regulatory factor (Ser/Thr protein kinase) [Sphingomonas sp. YR710]|uniref:ATP-binding protein n=1 Tax=Sphingomonas sp. YR710 TaxID=1882773 RepID=UPI00088D0CBF|nr:ATP-binding protein [Sphingomonas sp. YR710]SDD01999.1 Anti-sigma regulatory factor (Ser/Thr protein kinase) [Sphingomonas sp. YR710]
MDAGESKSEPWTVRCDGADAVRGAVTLARDFGAHHGLAAIAAARLAIVIEEIVTNAIEHGRVAAGDQVDLSLALQSGGVRVVFVEPGLPFDPRQATPATPVHEQRGGGAGLDLVKHWTRVVDYRTVDGINRLELILPCNGDAD